MSVHIRVGDRVDIKAGDEAGGWGIVKLILDRDPKPEYHVGLYASETDYRVYHRDELSRPYRDNPMTDSQKRRIFGTTLDL